MSVTIIKLKEKPGTGYNVSHSERKTKRLYLINKQSFSFYSRILGKKIIIKCSCRLSRFISKYSNIDKYLIHTRKEKIIPELVKIRKELFKKYNNQK